MLSECVYVRIIVCHVDVCIALGITKLLFNLRYSGLFPFQTVTVITVATA